MNRKQSLRQSVAGFNYPACVLWMAILLGFILFSMQGTAFGQPELTEPRDAPEVSGEKGDTTPPAMIDLRLYITSEIDVSIDSKNLPTGTQAFAKKFYNDYFDTVRTKALERMVSRSMQKVLNARLEDFALKAEISSNPDSAKKFEAYPNYYKITTTFWPVSDGSFYIGASVSQLWSAEPIFSTSYQKLFHLHGLDQRDWSELKLNKTVPILEQDERRILQELASTLVSRIDNEIVQWFVESSIKLRVAVLPFEAVGGDSTWHHLEKGLKAMVETELSRSEAIMIYADSSLRSPYADREPPQPNYEVYGSFFPVGNNLRIDLRCMKVRANRILTSNKVTVDALSVDQLSSKIAEASHRLKSAMLSDFRQSTKTLAIVAEPPIRYFSAEELSQESKDVAKLIVHNMTNKLQLLMAHSRQLDPAANLKICYCNPETIDDYIENFPNPADIINDLDIDYLVLVKTEDLGHTIRLSTNLHSYDLERPALAEYIHQDEGIKSRMESVIDTTVLRISQKLCDLGTLKAPQFCSVARKKSPKSLQKVLKNVRMIDFQRNKGVGIRIGLTSHDDPALYLGRESTVYYEIFFSLLLPHWRLPWWVSHELEASVGYDRGALTDGGLIGTKGVISVNGFLNYKLVFAGWQYASFPVVLSCGGGLGLIDMNVKYYVGDKAYTDSVDYNRGFSRLAGNAFVGIELPISDRFRLQAVIRRIFGTPEIEHLSETSFDKSVTDPPIGSLDGWFFMGGIKYIWR